MAPLDDFLAGSGNPRAAFDDLLGDAIGCAEENAADWSGYELAMYSLALAQAVALGSIIATLMKAPV